MLRCVNDTLNISYDITRAKVSNPLRQGYGTIRPLCLNRSKRRDLDVLSVPPGLKICYDLWLSLRENFSWNKSPCPPCRRVKFDPCQSYHAIRKSLKM